MTTDERLAALGITLPALSVPIANFAPAVRAGKLLFLSGQGPGDADGNPITGKVGSKYSADEARQHARLVGLRLLSIMQAELGSLDRVRRVAKLFGMVNAVPEFTRHPYVIDGCSDLFAEVFPELGRHARSAVGMSSLPFDITVEIEAIVEIREQTT